jgi:RHS repeat-associated protein
MKERIYLGGFELYREYAGDGQTVTLERETLHIMDDKQRIALVETRTQGNDPAPPQLIRYQFGNHLGSASLELDDQAQIISYEEYTPYGSTSYQAVRSQTETPKRYRYTGKERDEESGLYYHGARYYAAWLGRWVSCDPIGHSDAPNLYLFTRANPITSLDRAGMASGPDVYNKLPPWLQKKIMAGEANDQLSSSLRTARLTEFANVQPTRERHWEDVVLDVMTLGIWSIGWVWADNYEEVSNAPATSDWHPAAKTLAAVGMTAGDVTGIRNIVEGLREQDTLNTRTLSPDESFNKVVGGSVTLGTTLLLAAAGSRMGPKAISAKGGLGSEAIVIEGSGSAPRVAPSHSKVPLPNPGESALAYGQRVHQEFPRIVSETNPGAGGRFNVAPGLTGPDLPNPTGMNAAFAEMKPLWGRQGPMVSQARNWGFDAQTGRYFFYDRNTGLVFEGIIQTEKFPSGALRPKASKR